MPRRVVTGLDPQGISTILLDGPSPVTREIAGGSIVHEIWNTDRAPAPISPRVGVDPTERENVAPPDPNGTIIRLVDLPPGYASPMHQTETVDYILVLEGELHLVLPDSGTPLRPGDVAIQRGTDHAWENRSSADVRVAFILVDGRFTKEFMALTGEPDGDSAASLMDEA